MEAKRRKTDSTPAPLTLKAILPAEYEQEIPLLPVYVSHIANKREISKVMQELSQKLPLSGLQHLKRVNQSSIIVCQADELADVEAVKDHLHKCNLSEETIAALCSKVCRARVPSQPTRLRWQFDAMQKHWPCKFHPDKYLEALYEGRNFSLTEMEFHSKILTLAGKLSRELSDGLPFGICIDPRSGRVVALAGSHTQAHPAMHCPMVLIDFVARSQGGGAWNSLTSMWHQFSEEQQYANLAGIPKAFHDHIRAEGQFNELQFGAEPLQTKVSVAAEGVDNLAKYGPYLCTGYDVYLSNEPCLMCSMALVHSRVKRVFFLHASSGNGALAGSGSKLHTVKELNHHYEVFQSLHILDEKGKGGNKT